MVFLISILLGLSMGSGTVFSLQYGAGDLSALRRSIYVSLLLIGTVTILLNVVRVPMARSDFTMVTSSL